MHNNDHSVDLKSLTIRLASPSQLVAHVKTCFEIDEWRHEMIWEEYQVFYAREHASQWAMDNGALTWVLVRREDYDGEIYSTLVTHRIRCFYKPSSHGKVSSASPISNEWYYTITAVATPLALRGKGYARHLIQLLHYLLVSPSNPGCPTGPDGELPTFPVDKWGTPPLPISTEILPSGIASVLWSDIPISFYQRCTIGPAQQGGQGFRTEERWNWKLTWSLLPHIPSSDQVPSEYGWVPIWESELPEIGSILSKSQRRRLENTDTSSKAAFVPDPSSSGLLSFIRKRGSFLPDRSACQYKTSKEDIPWGLRLRHSSPPDGDESQNTGDTIVLFALENYQISRNLLITYIHNLKPDHLESLLSSLDEIVSESGMTPSREYGEIWGLNPECELVKRWKECERRDVELCVRGEDHTLGICGYADREMDVGDTQMWSWV